MKRSILLLQFVAMALVFCVAQQVAPDAIATTDRSTVTDNSSGTEPYRLRGLNFSPYTQPGENPNSNKPGQITPEELLARIEVIAPYAEGIRTFGCTDDLQPIGAMAHALGLKTAIGAWLGRNNDENMRQVNTLVELAEEGHVDMAIVGSEVLLRNDLPEGQLIQYIRDVKTRFQAAGIEIPVTTADVYGEFLSHPDILPEIDLVMANYYPYWEGKSLECGMVYLHRWHEQLQAAAKGKPVLVSEAGWPSCGDSVGEAVPSSENAADFFLQFVSWARANDVQYFYFSAQDEPWKSAYEGPQGACWGLWTSDGKLKTALAESDAELVKRERVEEEAVRQLTKAEAKALADCEDTIARGCRAFIEVGNALATIRDSQLYRQTHATFEDYVKERWPFGKAYAYRLIGAAETAAVLSPIGDKTAAVSAAPISR